MFSCCLHCAAASPFYLKQNPQQLRLCGKGARPRSTVEFGLDTLPGGRGRKLHSTQERSDFLHVSHDQCSFVQVVVGKHFLKSFFPMDIWGTTIEELWNVYII